MTTLMNVLLQAQTLSLEEQKQLIQLLGETIVAEALPRKRSILELEGLGANIWQDVDAEAYINELRDE